MSKSLIFKVLELFIRKFGICFLLFFYIFTVEAVKPVVLTDSLNELCIAREYVDFLEDPTGKLTIEAIRNEEAVRSKFIRSTAQDLINTNTQSVYWLRFKLYNKTTNNFRIEFFDYDIDDIRIYYPSKEGLTMKQAGLKQPFFNREVNHKNVSFFVPSTVDTSFTYVRVFSQKQNVLEPMLRSYDKILNYAINEYLFFGLFYGLLLLIILYNLIYFISLKKAHYAYIVLYGVGILIYLMSGDGTAFQYLWPNLPQVNDYTGETGLFISSISLLLFTTTFLALKSTNIKLHRIINICIVTRIAFFIIQLRYTNNHLFEAVDLIFTLVLLGILIIIYKQGNHSVKWLIIGFSILNVAFFITVLERSSTIPSGLWSVYASNLGIVAQFLLISIGVAESIKGVYKEKTIIQEKLITQLWKNERLSEKVNRELEEKVKARTHELDVLNESLKRKDEENIRMNIALDLANNQLKKGLSAFAQSSVIKEFLSYEEFEKAFPDEISCHRYLRDLKAQEEFSCIKCGSNKTIKGKDKFDVRCANCNYNESVTANTIFHRTKIPLQKAFYILHVTYHQKDKTNAKELAENLNLQPVTTQNFKRKTLLRMKTLKRKNSSWDKLIID